ncbi:MAG TPA: hypothetical protein VGO89_18035, partial [Streptomyces sp.]|nr:hypothetical protein [Streptomyces sp.]
ALSMTVPLGDVAPAPFGNETVVLRELRCAERIYRDLHAFCDSDTDWGVRVDPAVLVPTPGPGDSIVLRRGDVVGMATLLYEDFDPDLDHNDFVALLAQSCIAVLSTASPGELRVVSCNVRLVPMSKGGGYVSRLRFNYNGTLDPSYDPTPTAACRSVAGDLPRPVPTSQSPFFGAYASGFADALGNVASVRAYASEAARLSNAGGLYGCDLVAGSVYAGPEPVQPECATLRNDTDVLVLANTHEAMRSAPGGTPYVNTMQGSPAVAPDFTLATSLDVAFAPAFNSRQGVLDAMVADLLPRMVLENTDCRVLVVPSPNDPGFVDPSGVPYGILVEPPNAVRWTQEGLPVDAAQPICVHGNLAGAVCDDFRPTQCPAGYCWVFVGLCVRGSSNGDSCDRASECPFGIACYNGTGVYPYAVDFYACEAAGCYGGSPPFSCTGDGCYQPSVVSWFDYPSTAFPDSLWTFPYERFVPTAAFLLPGL